MDQSSSNPFVKIIPLQCAGQQHAQCGFLQARKPIQMFIFTTMSQQMSRLQSKPDLETGLDQNSHEILFIFIFRRLDHGGLELAGRFGFLHHCICVAAMWFPRLLHSWVSSIQTSTVKCKLKLLHQTNTFCPEKPFFFVMLQGEAIQNVVVEVYDPKGYDKGAKPFTS